VIGGTPTTTTGSPFRFSVTVSDSAGGTLAPAAFSLSVGPHVTLAAVKLSHQAVLGGNSTTDNRVMLTGPAPQTGALVSLSSGNPAVATVPASVAVHAGQTYSLVFNIATTAVATQTPVTISATYRGVTQTATLTVDAAQLTSLTLSPAEVVGGGSTTNNTVRPEWCGARRRRGGDADQRQPRRRVSASHRNRAGRRVFRGVHDYDYGGNLEDRCADHGHL
jgi:hypothetical protein